MPANVSLTAAHRDRGVRERRRRREPHGGADPRGDGGRREVRARRPDEREHQRHEARCGDHLADELPRAAARGGGQLRRHLEHDVRERRTPEAPRKLGADVRSGAAEREPARSAARRPPDPERDGRVEVRTRHRPEQRDEDPEREGGRPGVLEELQTDVVGREAHGHDPGAHDGRDEERGAEELRGQPTRERPAHATGATPSSPSSASTRRRISSRIGRTASMPCPAGSSSDQSS